MDEAGRDLLLGLLGAQVQLLTEAALEAGCRAWHADRSRPLGGHLIQQGALDEPRLQLLEALAAEHLRAHGGEPARSLAALSSEEPARQRLESLAEPDLLAGLTLEPSFRRSAGPMTADPFETRAPEPGDLIDYDATRAPESTNDAYVTKLPGPVQLFDPDATRIGGSSSGEVDSGPGRVAGGLGPKWRANRFRIIRLHARGGLGAVYMATDSELNREVALKEIQDHHADNPVSRGRFLLEAEITGALEHPGIVPVYGLGTYADGRPFYAMRFIKGESLRDVIRRYHDPEAGPRDLGARSLELRGLLRRFLDVCNAVAYAHSKGVLHRDLKPANIMLGRYGETLVVDWGLAKATGRSGTDAFDEAPVPSSSGGGVALLTMAGSRIGTLGYMSPEQAAGRLDELGPASDVYSLGATLYTLLTGTAPFEAGSEDLDDRVARGGFAPPRQVRPEISAALEAICLKAMATDPADRYAGSRELADDLEHWLADEPVVAYLDREPATARLARWGRHHSAAVAGAASVLLCGLALLAVFLVLTRRAQALAESKADSEGRAALREAALRGEAEAAAAQAKAESAKVLSVTNLMVDTFRASDPIGIESIGFRADAEVGRTLTAGDILERAAAKIVESLRDEPLVRADLMDSIGDVRRGLGELDAAEPLLREALAIRRAALPPDHPDVAESLFHVAWLEQDRGDFDEAVRRYREVIAMRSAREGSDSDETLLARFNLGITLAFMGEGAAAETELRHVLAVREQREGPDGRGVALARFGLAGALLEEHKFPEALIQSARAMTSMSVRGQESKVGLVAANFQAGFVRLQLHDLDGAEARMRKALEYCREAFGPKHPYNDFMLFYLAEIAAKRGNYAEAEAASRECLEIARSVVGLAHPKVLIGVFQLITLLERRGAYDEAVALTEETLAAVRSRFGAEHPLFANALLTSSYLSDQHGDTGRTVLLLREAVSIYRQNPGVQRVNYATALNNLGNALSRRGQAAEAVGLLEECLLLSREEFGGRSQDVAIILSNLGSSLIAVGRLDEARRQLEEARDLLKPGLLSIPGTEPPQALVHATEDLARLATLEGEADQAEAYRREAANWARKVFRDDPVAVAVRLENLAVTIAQGGRPGRSSKPLDEALELVERVEPVPAGFRARLLAERVVVGVAAHEETAALEAARRLAALDPPDEPEAALRSTRALLLLPGFEAPALTFAEAANRDRPPTRAGLVGLADALEHAGRPDEALARLSESDALPGPTPDDPDVARSDLIRSRAFDRLGRSLEVAEAASRASRWVEAHQADLNWTDRLEFTARGLESSIGSSPRPD